MNPCRTDIFAVLAGGWGHRVNGLTEATVIPV